MTKLSSAILQAVKRSPLTDAQVVAAIDAAGKQEPKPPQRKTRIYNRRDMVAES